MQALLWIFGVKTLLALWQFFGAIARVVKMVSLGRAVFWWETARFSFHTPDTSEAAW